MNRAEEYKVITIRVVEINYETLAVKYSMAFDKQNRVQRPFVAYDPRSRTTVHQLEIGKKYAVNQVVLPHGTSWVEAEELDSNGGSKIKHDPIKAAVFKQRHNREINTRLQQVFDEDFEL